MSIVVKKTEDQDVPSDYVKCSKEEAIEHQWKTIHAWQSAWDIWPFKQGPAILSVTAAISGGMIASYFRLRLNLSHYGRMAMLLPTMGIPGAFTPILNLKLVGEPVMIQSECPVCLQMRSMLVQNLLGIGYPIVLSAGTGMHLAERYATYRLPEFTFRAIPQFVNIARNILTSHKNGVIALAIINTLVAGFITDRQANSIFTIARKLEEEEIDVGT
ncbi:hypothetical protein GE061_011329 [Apolygus lucorum]|uniref:Transmembrane protein 126A n=1 Tax=Apolygus lucorum TaxID=248454 RepID=A0A6A4K728_APOLU|nr:hypothetical protein GE061_011329 [Apolygus lucorum]